MASSPPTPPRPAVRLVIWTVLLAFVGFAAWTTAGGYRQQNTFDQNIDAAYAFVVANGQVSSELPCFCGCKQNGHASLDMCFVGRRDREGRMVSRDPHAETCEICIDVALLAEQLHKKGATPAQIRSAVEVQYGGTSPMNPPAQAQPSTSHPSR